MHVRLTNEAVDVWRPVKARRLSPTVYQLDRSARPEDETWAFQPGETVVVEPRAEQGGEPLLVAVARASDLDSISAVYARRAG